MMNDDIGQHHTDPHETELEGAEHIAAQKQTLLARVLDLFEFHGPMTDEELLDRYVAKWGAIYKNSLEPRRYELMRDGLVERSGHTKKGRSGVRRIVWQLADLRPPQYNPTAPVEPPARPTAKQGVLF